MATPTFSQLQGQIAIAEVNAEQAQTREEAIKATLDAAELCLRALELTPKNEYKKQIEHKCHTLLDHAEQIKKVESDAPDEFQLDKRSSDPSRLAAKPRPKETRSSRQLTTREQIILLEGSKLHGTVFPPWQSPPEASEFELPEGQLKFVDNFNFKFSDLQLEVFNGWQRPSEIISRKPATSSRRDKYEEPAGTAIRIDLVQDVTTDCSVVASLCAGTARRERGYPEILSSIVHPYDDRSMQPAMSPNGKHVLKLHFNGCDRKVVIDDRLPSSNSSRSLYVIDRNDASLLWPALVEKAYLKVRGGYDMSGSNSGTDIWLLTGWIPEQLFFQSDEINRAALWLKITEAFLRGNVLVTMGTGKLTEMEEESMGLAGEHDYAILDMKEDRGQRLMLVKNPWSKATVWKGSSAYAHIVETAKPAEEAGPRASKPQRLTPGTFWMDLNDIFQSFESMYMNWDPALFSCRQDVHFSWNLATSRGPSGLLRSNPQYQIRVGASCVVWLLLSKHFRSQPKSLGDRGLSRANINHGFISLYASENGGARVFKSDETIVRGPYVDSPNTLLKLELSAMSTYNITVSEQALPWSSFNFTLSAFSNEQLMLEQAREKYTHRVLQRGAWTISSPGGNTSSSMYQSNPSFRFQLEGRSDVALLLEAEDEHICVHVKLVWFHQRSVTWFTTRDILGDSGEYIKGFALAELKNVEPGAYVVVCSTFDQGQAGKFRLYVETNCPCKVDGLLPAGAGRLVTKLETAFSTADSNRLVAPLFLSRLTRLRVTARSLQDTAATAKSAFSPLKVGVEHGQGASRSVIAVTGNDEFLDSCLGLETHDVDLQPRMCQPRGLWVFVERLGHTSTYPDAESISIEVLSDAPIEVGQWTISND